MSSLAPPLLTLMRLINRGNAHLGQACAWLTLFLVLATTLIVVLRYGFGIGATALQETVMYAHALIFMGAAAWALQRDEHVRVDIFYQQFSARRKALSRYSATCCFSFPFVCFSAGTAGTT